MPLATCLHAPKCVNPVHTRSTHTTQLVLRAQRMGPGGCCEQAPHEGDTHGRPDRVVSYDTDS
jgi:hypothetical protein